MKGVTPSAIETTGKEKLDKMISIQNRAYATQLQVEMVKVGVELEALPKDLQLL